MGKLQRETVSEPDPLQLPAAQRTGSACQATPMKRILLASLLLLLALAYGLHLLWPQLGGGVPEGEPAAMDTTLGQRASAFLNALESDDYALAHAAFDPHMREALPEAKLREIWQTLPRQIGPLRSRGEASMERVQGTATVVTPLHFERFNLDARTAFDDSARISGFYLVPARRAPALPSSGERKIMIGAGASALPGTPRLPDAPGADPLVVLLHGFAPHDRDEPIGPNGPFRELAEGLARVGVAPLRYEKRSRQHPHVFAAGSYTVDLQTPCEPWRLRSRCQASTQTGCSCSDVAFKDGRQNRFVAHPEANHLFQQGQGPTRSEEDFLAAAFDPDLASDLAEWIGELQP